MKTLKYEVQISGFIIGLLLVTLFAIGLASFSSSISQSYNLTDNTSFTSYNNTQTLLSDLEDIQNSTNIQQDEGALDVIGGFFTSGYSALKVTVGSYSVFESMMRQASDDVPMLNTIFIIFQAMILVLIVVGLILAVLLKMRT